MAGMFSLALYSFSDSQNFFHVFKSLLLNVFGFLRLQKLLNCDFIFEGLPGVLGNKGTLAKYRREQGNISQFLGTGNKISKNYSTKTF